MPIAYLRIVFINHPRRARCQTKTAFTEHNGLGKIRRGVGDVMVKPERAIRVIGQVGDDIAIADIYQTVLHELGLDEQIAVDGFEFRYEPPQTSPSKSARVTSLMGE